MTISDRYYLEARAEEEIERAQQATDPGAVASHYYMAELYLERLYGAASTDIVTPTSVEIT